jgi:hypothetical protein
MQEYLLLRVHIGEFLQGAPDLPVTGIFISKSGHNKNYHAQNQEQPSRERSVEIHGDKF